MGLKLKGFKLFRQAIDSAGFGKACRKSLLRTAGIVGKLAEAQVRKVISERSADFQRNAFLTAAIKGNADVLKGTKGAELWNSVTSKVVNWNRVFVGVLRTSGGYQIAEVVHNGKIIKVTPAMRGLFLYLHLASTGEKLADGRTGDALLTSPRAKELAKAFLGWHPLKASTTQIVIPPRPFIVKAIDDEQFKADVLKYWTVAIKKAFKARLKRGQ